MIRLRFSAFQCRPPSTDRVHLRTRQSRVLHTSTSTGTAGKCGSYRRTLACLPTQKPGWQAVMRLEKTERKDTNVQVRATLPQRSSIAYYIFRESFAPPVVALYCSSASSQVKGKKPFSRPVLHHARSASHAVPVKRSVLFVTNRQHDCN